MESNSMKIVQFFSPKTIFSIMGLSIFLTTQAHAADSLKQAFLDGDPYINMRYRYEFVDQDGLSEQAHASTLRTQLGYKSGDFHGFSAGIEFENVAPIASDNYNDTTNGQTNYPVVVDVESTEVNQAFLQYDGLEDTRIKLGRQRFTLDDHRFIGSVAWRQNDQTFDAVTITNKSIEDTTLTYGYINNVNRIFSDDSPNGNWESNSHVVHAAYNGLSFGKLTAYGYFLDFEQDAPAASSQTYGLHFNSKELFAYNDVKFGLHAEYARQSEHGDNPLDFDVNYFHAAPSVSWKGLTATLGYEVLGSDDGTVGFATPLATLHKFNGFADKFLNTPAAGLEDVYVQLKYKFPKDASSELLQGLFVLGAYHDFSSDEGSIDYGTEFNFHIQKPINDNYYVQARFADYNADNFATDTQKLIVGIGLKF